MISEGTNPILKLKAKTAPFIKVYLFSIVSVVSFGITFLQSFLFAAILSKEEFGKVLIVSTLFSVFSYLSVFGLDTTLFKYYHDTNVDSQGLNKHIFFSWLILSFGLFIFLSLIGSIFIFYFDFNLISFSSEYILLLISGICYSFFLIFQQRFIAAKKILFYSLFTVGTKAIILAFNLISIIVFGSDLFYFILSYLIPITFLLLISIRALLNSNAGALKKMVVIDILQFSLPLSINSFISIAFTNGYRLLISSLMSLNQFATFGIISQIASAYYLGVSAIILPHNSEAYKELNKFAGKAKSIPTYFKKCLIIGITGLILVVLISTFLLKCLKNGIYFEGFIMLPILLVGQFFFILYSHDYIVLTFFRRTSKITLATMIGIILILILFYPLINLLGILGACIVMLIGYFSQFISASIFRRAILV